MARRKLHDSPTVSWQHLHVRLLAYSLARSLAHSSLPLSFFDSASLSTSVYQLTPSTVRTGVSVLMLIDLDSCVQ